jgi:hypothetical protein
MEKQTGQVPFKTRIGLASKQLTANGSFNAIISCTPKVGDVVWDTVKVNITTYSCISDVAGIYTIDYFCEPVNVEKDRDLAINNGPYGTDTLNLYIRQYGYCYAVLNCRAKKFNIPYQKSASGVSIQGSGTFVPGGDMLATYMTKDANGNVGKCSAAKYFRIK